MRHDARDYRLSRAPDAFEASAAPTRQASAQVDLVSHHHHTSTHWNYIFRAMAPPSKTAIHVDEDLDDLDGERISPLPRIRRYKLH